MKKKKSPFHRFIFFPISHMHRSVTVKELREHDTKHEEKWIAVEDVVFDVSNFKHPGGRNLLFPHLGTVAVGSLFFYVAQNHNRSTHRLTSMRKITIAQHTD